MPQVTSRRSDWPLRARVHILLLGHRPQQSAVSVPWQSARMPSPASRRLACLLVMAMSLLSSLSLLLLRVYKDLH